MPVIKNPLGVFEDIEHAPSRELFRLGGVSWRITPLGWLSPVHGLILGGLVAFLIPLPLSIGQRILNGLIFGLLFTLTNFAHSLGHVIGGQVAGSPMDANLITFTRHVNRYTNDQAGLPSRVHLLRALGGPVMNLALGLAGGVLWLVMGRPLGEAWALGLAFFAALNLLFGLGALQPLPSVDGEVIFRELLRPKRAG